MCKSRGRKLIYRAWNKNSIVPPKPQTLPPPYYCLWNGWCGPGRERSFHCVCWTQVLASASSGQHFICPNNRYMRPIYYVSFLHHRCKSELFWVIVYTSTTWLQESTFTIDDYCAFCFLWILIIRHNEDSSQVLFTFPSSSPQTGYNLSWIAETWITFLVIYSSVWHLYYNTGIEVHLHAVSHGIRQFVWG